MTFSADVRIITLGHIMTALRTEPVMRSLMTPVGVLTVYHLKDYTASQREVRAQAPYWKLI